MAVLASVAVLCGCSSSRPGAGAAVRPATSESTGDIQVLESASFGFRIEIPKGWTAQPGAHGSGLANNAWKAYAAPGSQGTLVATLVVPGSNHITDAELRIGVSRARDEIRACAALPSTARSGSKAFERIGGVDFTKFAAGDAAMGHYLDVHGFRAVHEGACYALDLLVYGVDPRMYDPPREPPFPKEQAFAEMHAVLRSFRFTR